jgi:hypothetical protein
MFILLSGLADTSSKVDVETRIGQTMRTSGIAITITSITDVIAFCAGAASAFPSVRNFSWYTGMYVRYTKDNLYTVIMYFNKNGDNERSWCTCKYVTHDEKILYKYSMNKNKNKNKNTLLNQSWCP